MKMNKSNKTNKSNTFKINLTSTKHIHCLFTDSQGTQTSIYLQHPENTHKTSPIYPLTIHVTETFISLCSFHKDSFTFIDDLFSHPNEFKKYSFCFQGKKYDVIAEVLFAMIINEFIQNVPQKQIITKTILSIDESIYDEIVEERLVIALKAIGLRVKVTGTCSNNSKNSKLNSNDCNDSSNKKVKTSKNIKNNKNIKQQINNSVYR